ncbi:hypothetical protein Ahy_A04g019255 isoform E [Arachis hypogaea]|uniref:Protein root UVB sensitive/RUS domain-containing protein n=1 Tax=Arachis hypogaea TaxID=3818 RepID=A0A445DFM9_ARAHY|nr:hypothetical protein Ahy_A04g019255 isoform E [Arachis hypogaea]
MSHTLRISFPTSRSSFNNTSLKRVKRSRNHHFPQIQCSSKHSSLKYENHANNEGGEGLSKVILVERYSNGTAKRYVLGDDSQLQTILVEEDSSTTNRFQDLNSFDGRISWLPQIIKDFVLPAGFPGSVSDDYLNYMLLQFPTNVTGWICHTLAVGIGSFSGTTAAASAAAISFTFMWLIACYAFIFRWVTKDGIGAVGRLFIGLAIMNEVKESSKLYADMLLSTN